MLPFIVIRPMARLSRIADQFSLGKLDESEWIEARSSVLRKLASEG
jgi:hypothetical protein